MWHTVNYSTSCSLPPPSVQFASIPSHQLARAFANSRSRARAGVQVAAEPRCVSFSSKPSGSSSVRFAWKHCAKGRASGRTGSP